MIFFSALQLILYLPNSFLQLFYIGFTFMKAIIVLFLPSTKNVPIVAEFSKKLWILDLGSCDVPVFVLSPSTIISICSNCQGTHKGSDVYTKDYKSEEKSNTINFCKAYEMCYQIDNKKIIIYIFFFMSWD